MSGRSAATTKSKKKRVVKRRRVDNEEGGNDDGGEGKQEDSFSLRPTKRAATATKQEEQPQEPKRNTMWYVQFDNFSTCLIAATSVAEAEREARAHLLQNADDDTVHLVTAFSMNANHRALLDGFFYSMDPVIKTDRDRITSGDLTPADLSNVFVTRSHRLPFGYQLVQQGFLCWARNAVEAQQQFNQAKQRHWSDGHNYNDDEIDAEHFEQAECVVLNHSESAFVNLTPLRVQ